MAIERLGHYRLLERIGVGGMGEVYRARVERIDREVAIKILPLNFRDDMRARDRPQNEAMLQRFEFQSPSTAINGAYSYPDITTLTTLSAPQKAGCAP
jgi:serine/threonine protein kinase